VTPTRGRSRPLGDGTSGALPERRHRLAQRSEIAFDDLGDLAHVDAESSTFVPVTRCARMTVMAPAIFPRTRDHADSHAARLPKGARPHPVFHEPRCGGVDPDAEDFLGRMLEAEEIDEGSFRLKLHQEVHVTVARLFATRDGPKDAKVAYAVSPSGFQETVAGAAHQSEARAPSPLACARRRRNSLEHRPTAAGQEESLQRCQRRRRRARFIPCHGRLRGPRPFCEAGLRQTGPLSGVTDESRGVHQRTIPEEVSLSHTHTHSEPAGRPSCRTC
jgi:hypothetical protein